jgi:hypothetical protein
MSLKHKTYLEFLQRMPSRNEIDEYQATLTPENIEQFQCLMLFGFFGMEQLARERKLIGIGDMYFTFQGLVTMLISVLAAVSLNRLVFQFDFIGFASIFALFTLAGWSYLIFYRKQDFYINRSTLWKIILNQYLSWVDRDADGFVETLDEYIDEFPKQKRSKILTTVRNQVAR